MNLNIHRAKLSCMGKNSRFKKLLLATLIAESISNVAFGDMFSVGPGVTRENIHYKIGAVFVNGTLKNSSFYLVPGSGPLFSDPRYSGEALHAFNGSTVDSVTIENGRIDAHEGSKLHKVGFKGERFDLSGEAESTVIAAGQMNVKSGGVAGATVISPGSSLDVAEGGMVTGSQINGAMVNSGGMDKGTVIKRDASFQMNGGGKSEDLTIESGALASVASGQVVNAIINGAMEFSAGNTADKNASLLGSVAVNDAGRLSLSSNVDAKSANVTVTDSGAVYLTDESDFSMGNVVMNGGSVHFQTTDDSLREKYSTLTVESLKGAGSFFMNTRLSSLQGDFLNVTGEATGRHLVYVADTGVSPLGDASLKLVQIGSGDAEFALGNVGQAVDMGTYQYHLVSNESGGWLLSYLSPPVPPDPEPEVPVVVVPDPIPDPEPEVPPVVVPDPIPEPEPEVPPVVVPDPIPDPEPEVPPVVVPEPKPAPAPIQTPQRVISPSTAAVLSMANTGNTAFYGELDAVERRIDSLDSAESSLGVWGQALSRRDRAHSSAGAGYSQNLDGIVIGVDKAIEQEGGVSNVGLFFSSSRSQIGFERGGSGAVDSYSVGAYGKYTASNGVFIDGIVKMNKFNNTVKARMNSGQRATAEYDATGIGAKIQVGRNFHFDSTYVAPYASVTAFKSSSENYSLSNGMKAQVGSVNSVLGEVGVKVGHTWAVSNETVIKPFVKLGSQHEFVKSNAVRVNDDTFTNDYSGSRMTYQFGVEATYKKDFTINVGAGRSTGENTKSPWAGSVGISYSFD